MFKEEQIIKICKQNKWRLTEPRLEVLRIISLSKNPIKAYDILKKLANKIKNPKPPTAYRAIQFGKNTNLFIELKVSTLIRHVVMDTVMQELSF